MTSKFRRSKTPISFVSALMLSCATVTNGYTQTFTQEQIDAIVDRLRGTTTDQASANQGFETLERAIGRQGERLAALEAQVAVLIQMQLQLTAGVNSETVAARSQSEKTVLQERINAMPNETPEEKELRRTAAEFASITGSVPTSPEQMAMMTPEDMKRIETRTREAKSQADKALEDYVEKVLIPQVQKQCPKISPDQQRELVTAARNASAKQEVRDLAERFRCEISDDLLRDLATARDAEQAQAAFSQAMTSLMMMAVMSGNPYVAAIAAVIMLIMALFGDGNGDGNGDGKDDKPGEGPGQAPATKPTPSTSVPEPKPTPQPEPQPEPVVIVPPSTGNLVLKGGSNCLAQFGGSEQILVLSPADTKVEQPFSIDIKKIDTDTNFPQTWNTAQIVLHSCNFSDKSVQIVWTVPPGNATCSSVTPLAAPTDEGETYWLVDGNYAAPTDTCSKP